MILVLLQIMIPAMGLLFIDKLIKNEGLWGQKKYWYGAMGVIALIGVVLLVSPKLSGDFIIKKDFEFYAQYSQKYKDSAATELQKVNLLKAAATNQLIVDSLMNRVEFYQKNAENIDQMASACSAHRRSYQYLQIRYAAFLIFGHFSFRSSSALVAHPTQPHAYCGYCRSFGIGRPNERGQALPQQR
jgi:hypothetical protein